MTPEDEKVWLQEIEHDAMELALALSLDIRIYDYGMEINRVRGYQLINQDSIFGIDSDGVVHSFSDVFHLLAFLRGVAYANKQMTIGNRLVPL